MAKLTKLCAAGLMLAVLCAARGGAQEGHRRQRVASVSYPPLLHGLPSVELKLNGATTARFLLDTGTTNTVITDRLVRKLGLAEQLAFLPDGKPLKLPSGQQAREVTVGTLELGDLRLRDVPLIVVVSKTFPSFLGDRVDGVVGVNFLSHFAVLIDFPRQQITLWYPGALEPVDLDGMGMGGSITIPLEKSENEFSLIVRARLNDRLTEDMVVDTGASGTVISARAARELELVPIEEGVTVRTYGGVVKRNKALLATLGVGGLVINGHVVSYDRDARGHSAPALGLDILARYRVLVDAQGGRLYLKAPAGR